MTQLKNNSEKSGYIYVLINPSLKNIVKIGQTKRSPEDRADEISAATGVPTPFIVAYDQYVIDPEYVEQQIHTVLSEKGHRVRQNREFFEISVKEAIHTIIEICGAPSHQSKIPIEKQQYGRKPGEEQYYKAIKLFYEIDENLELWKNEDYPYVLVNKQDYKVELPEEIIELLRLSMGLGYDRAKGWLLYDDAFNSLYGFNCFQNVDEFVYKLVGSMKLGFDGAFLVLADIFKAGSYDYDEKSTGYGYYVRGVGDIISPRFWACDNELEIESAKSRQLSEKGLKLLQQIDPLLETRNYDNRDRKTGRKLGVKLSRKLSRKLGYDSDYVCEQQILKRGIERGCNGLYSHIIESAQSHCLGLNNDPLNSHYDLVEKCLLLQLKNIRGADHYFLDTLYSYCEYCSINLNRGHRHKTKSGRHKSHFIDPTNITIAGLDLYRDIISDIFKRNRHRIIEWHPNYIYYINMVLERSGVPKIPIGC